MKNSQKAQIENMLWNKGITVWQMTTFTPDQESEFILQVLDVTARGLCVVVTPLGHASLDVIFYTA